MTDKEFLAHWNESIQEMQQNPARRRVTADESSWRVWETGDSSEFGGLSYYEKGALIGLCLDLKIRHVTENRRSLDDVMRLLLRDYGLPKAGYGEDDLKKAVNAVTGKDLSNFYDLLARSTEEMPFAECLAYAGLDLNCNSLPDATPAQLALRKDWVKAEEK